MIGSIIIKHNPVTLHERYLLTAVPNPGITEAVFTDYSPDDRSEGGFWSCRFVLNGRPNLLREMFESGLGRHVEVWGYGLQQDFEGYIHEMTYHVPPDSFTIGLENMTNKIWMRTDYDGDGNIERTTELTDAESDTRFGTKESVLSGGEIQGLTVADQAVQTYLNLRAWPKPEASLGLARGDERLEIFCRGYIHTLSWRIYNQTASTGSQGMSAQIATVLTAAGEFIAETNIAGNATLVTKEYDADRKALDIILDMAKLGDSQNNRWLAYMIGKNSVQVLGRQFVLKQAAPSVIS